MATVAVLSGPERRRRWTTAEKLRLVAESSASGLSVIDFARRHDLHLNLVHAWRRQAKNDDLSVAVNGAARFRPVAVAAENSVAHPIRNDDDVGSIVEVMLRNGRLVRFSDRMAPGRAALLADALEGCAR
jgi:transposase-like protein